MHSLELTHPSLIFSLDFSDVGVVAQQFEYAHIVPLLGLIAWKLGEDFRAVCVVGCEAALGCLGDVDVDVCGRLLQYLGTNPCASCYRPPG